MAENARDNPTPKQQQKIMAESPVKTPAVGQDTPDAATQAEGFGNRRRTASPQAIAEKVPAGLPPIDADRYASDSADPVRRAASRIRTVDNANMAATDNTVDVDGKGMEARHGASEWQDNVIYSNASPDAYVDTPDEGLGGIDSRRAGILPPIALRAGWRVSHVGTVAVERGETQRAEQMIRFEPDE